MGRRKTNFDESARDNNYSYMYYVDRLTELAISQFKWSGLPDTCDSKFLERTLFLDGACVFFKDDAIGYLNLQVTVNGGFDVYGYPIERRAYAINGYNQNLNASNSVIIYNNYLLKNTYSDIIHFAKRLWELDRIIDVNARAQKTPVLIQGTEQQRLTLINLYQKYDGNEPVICADKNLDLNSLKALRTDAPYIGDKIYQLKTEIWNEALTHLGISNINVTKKERLVVDEVERLQGGTIASRFSRLLARQEACEKINDMFGLDVWCEFREYEGEGDEDVSRETLDGGMVNE